MSTSWMDNIGNSTCNACGYRNIRSEGKIYCPACRESEGGELILDAKPTDSEVES